MTKKGNLILIFLCEYEPSSYTFLSSINPLAASARVQRQWTLLLRVITIDNRVTNHLIPLESFYPCASRGNIIPIPISRWEKLSRVMMQWNGGRFVKLIKWAPGRAISRHHWSMFKVSESWWWPPRLCTESTAEKVNQTLADWYWSQLLPELK